MAFTLTCWVRTGSLVGLLLAGLAGAKAATNETAWFARLWQSEDGLPNNIVAGLAQTPDGYLWLGYPSGLARFDGVRFQEFSLTNFVGGDNRGIRSMVLGRDGGLRLAMDRGALVCLNAGTALVYSVKTDLPDLIVQNIVEDGEGSLWISYRGGAVCRIKDGRTTSFTVSEGLPSGTSPCSLARDYRGRLWFAKDGHFGTFREGRFQTILPIDRTTACLARAGDGGVWICSGTRLLKYTEGNKLEDFGSFCPPGTGADSSVLLEDSSGAVWIGTSFNGLFRFDGARFESVETSHPAILSLAPDREGNLWVGTAGGGLNRVRPRAVELQGVESGLPFPAVQSLCEDASGRLWATTQNGALAQRDDGRWRAVLTNAFWPGDATCVAGDPSGAVWVGTRRHGLFCWRDGRFVTWGKENGLRGQTIHTLVVSRAGDLWIGEQTPNAVQCLRGGQLLDFPVSEDVRAIRTSTEDADGNIWFGTSLGTLLKVSGDRITDETSCVSEAPLSIRCLYATPDGSLWIGHAGWGVSRIKNGRCARIRTAQGLYNDFVSQIVADGDGWLWFGCDRGIFKVHQRELDAVADGRATRVQSVYYGRGEGLPVSNANSGESPGAIRTRDGRLWMPMSTALAVIDPRQLRQDPRPPPVVLSRVAMDDRTVAWYGGVLPMPKLGSRDVFNLQSPDAALRLPADHRRLEFEFTALSFIGSENVQFRYRLEGLDDDWIEAGTQRSVVYSRLPAKGYRFQVRISNSDETWNESGAVLNLVVLPFFWQTWWFRIAMLGAFTVAVIAVVRYVSFRRLRLQLRAIEHQAALHRERARIAKDIHDDLGANLTQIALLGELAQQDRTIAPEKAGEHIETISGTARQAIRSLDEIVWAVNPRNDTLTHLIDYTGQFALDYLRVAGIRCRLDLPELASEHEISTEVRHNFFLVVKEALHNVVKHARASEVWLRVTARDQTLQMVIEDNGRGFEVPAGGEDPQGEGLRNMRQRVAEIGGHFRIESRAGAGTKVRVELPGPRRNERRQGGPFG